MSKQELGTQVAGALTCAELSGAAVSSENTTDSVTTLLSGLLSAEVLFATELHHQAPISRTISECLGIACEESAAQRDMVRAVSGFRPTVGTGVDD